MDLRDKIKDIVRYEYMNFMRYPNVVGVGRGNKYINNVDTGNLCIKVYVKEKYEKGYNEPGFVPKSYLGIPTDVIETGEFTAHKGFFEKIRPVKMGYSISALSTSNEYGTLGCIVTRYNSSGNLEFFVLSCNHVMADSNRLPIGTYIMQPAGSMNIANVIAKLSEFKPLEFITPQSRPENIIDAAIAKITDINIVRPQIAFMTVPKGVEYNAFPNAFIKKSGGITGYTTGKILDDTATIVLTYSDGRKVLFIDQILADIEDDRGDSGSIILDEYDNIIGMLIGGGTDDVVLNRIENISDIMKVSPFTQG